MTLVDTSVVKHNMLKNVDICFKEELQSQKLQLEIILDAELRILYIGR